MDQEQTHALWQLEEQFWLGSTEFYDARLAPDALMVLPPPAGVLDRAATIASIREGGRWRDVSLGQRHVATSGAATAVLAYVARADQGSPESAYAAQCSSTYVREGEQWRLLLHQQTPLPIDPD